MNRRVYGLSDMSATTNATLSQARRDQHGRSIAVSHTDQILCAASRSAEGGPQMERRLRLGSAGRRTVQVATRPLAI